MSLETYTQPFSEAIETTARQSLATHDVLEPLGNWQPDVADNGGLVLTHKTSNRQYRLTNTALNQLCIKSKIPQTIPKFLAPQLNAKGETIFERDSRDTQLVVDILRHHIFNSDRYDQDKPYLVRTNNDDNTIRAFLSEKYAIVNNVWFLEKLQEYIGDTEVLAARWRGDADTIYGELIFPNTRQEYDDSVYYAGLAVGNSEIGTRRAVLDSFIFREVCTNGLTSKSSSANRQSWVHLGSPKLDEIEEWIATVVAMGNDNAVQTIQEMQKMREIGIDKEDMAGVFVQLMQKLKIANREQSKIWQFLDEERGVIGDNAASVFGIHSALTRYAQTLDNSDWVKMEETSSKLLAYDSDKIKKMSVNASKIDIEHLVA